MTEDFENTPVGRLILNVRAFAGEVEQEKIAERTMRGKLERARSGKLPQGTGKGIYGYRYNRDTGRRDVDPYQAMVVQRIFQGYAESQSFSKVSNELNEAAIPSFSGGRWYPLTIRRLLTHESYVGRTIYRKTKRVKVRNSNGHGPKSRVVDQPSEDWITIEGSTPRIIEDALWQRVQKILNDPERTRRRPTTRFYPLRGRLRCGICGSAMVGQTLTVKSRPYRYYRCRHVYDKNTGTSCTAKYVSGNRLEDAVWGEVKHVLTDPDVVLQELKRSASGDSSRVQREDLERALLDIDSQEKRLVDLYTVGGISESVVRVKSEELSQQRTVLEAQLALAQTPIRPKFDDLDADGLRTLCAQVADWLDRAGDSERNLALEALQVSVSATKASATVSGVLPVERPAFISDEPTSRCSCSGDYSWLT